MNYPAAELRGIRCHAGLDKPAPAICKPGAPSLDFWIPAFAGMTIRCKWAGYEKENTNFAPSPADCKKLSIYSQHPSPQGEGTSGNPTASGWSIKNRIKTKSHLEKMSVDKQRLDEKKDSSAHRLPVMRVNLYNRPLRTFGGSTGSPPSAQFLQFS